MKRFSDATQLLYVGKETRGLNFNKPQVFPYCPSVTFKLKHLSDQATEKFSYARMNNPDTEALGDVVSFLEKGEASLIFSSGMGAIATTLMTLLAPGDELICNQSIYGETHQVMTAILRKFGITVTFVDFDDMDRVREAINPKVKVLYTEVMANPILHIADIEELSKIAHKNDAKLVVDNTFTTPIAIRPLTLGADAVVHSLTKYMNGGSDIVAGSVTANNELIDRIWFYRIHLGTSGDAYSAFSILKNVETLNLRVRKQMETAAKLAKALEAHPVVKRVYHPSLESFPQHELAMKMFESPELMTGMLSFEVPEGDDFIQTFDRIIERMELVCYAGSLGGKHTTLMHPVTTSHQDVPDAERRAMGITPGVMRVSVGLEEAEDLIQDFYYALDVLK